MLFKSVVISSLAALAVASPGGKPPSYPTTTKTWGTKTSSAPASAPTGGFINQCENFGLSLLDCTQLANIAALNGNSINIGGGTATPAAPVNNAGPFLNSCKNFGISVADCAQILNLAILNGNTVNISAADLTALITALGGLLSGLGLGDLIPIGNGLYTIPPNVI